MNVQREHALRLVARERDRAEQLRDQGHLRYTAADPDCPSVLRLAALVEEVGEVARAVHDNTDTLDSELVQVAAVAVAWLESRTIRAEGAA